MTVDSTGLTPGVYTAMLFVQTELGIPAAQRPLPGHSPIAGTMDDPLYQDQRIGQEDYRFENLPAGVYQVELRFAELIYLRPGRRLFDVVINNNLVLPAHDIVLEVGPRAADDQTFYLTVNGGRLDVRFIPRFPFGRPVINALRVTQRPDR